MSEFRKKEAKGNLNDWVKRCRTPREVADALSQSGIEFAGKNPSSSARKKIWMFTRWMVRPYPDLRYWTHLNPADLVVLVDRNVARVAVRFGWLNEGESGPLTKSYHAIRITMRAKEIFAQDPARIDYPCFC
ncbi:MAG: DUF2400 family protein [bacterium JZ-2024 1]